jgi:hypothetical protein
MREWVTCPCGNRGRVRIVAEQVTVFWRRTDGKVTAWWRDIRTGRDETEGALCGYCGVGALRLIHDGFAERKA